MIHNRGGFFGSCPKPDTLDTASSNSKQFLHKNYLHYLFDYAAHLI